MIQPTQPTNAPLQAQIANDLIEIKNALATIKNALATPTQPTTAKLSIDNLVNEYGISKNYVHVLMKNGAIPYAKIGRRTLFDRESIELYFASKTCKKTKK